MGKARQTGNLVSENLISVNTTTDTVQIGTGVTIYGGSVGIVSAAQFTGNATNATDATNAANVSITNDVTTNSTRYINFTDGTSGNQNLFVSSTKLTYNPNTGALSAPTANIGNIQVTTGLITATSGVVTYYGDGSQLTGVSGGGGSGSFNTGISSNVGAVLTGIGSTVFTFPSTANKRYIVYSINAANVAAGNTEVNVIGAYNFNGGDSRNYFAYNIPIPTGTAVELLKQPMVLNPSDGIVMRSTDFVRAGIDTAVEVYIVYEESNNVDYFGVGVAQTSITGIGTTAVYTSTSFPSVLQSIRITNITDTGDYPVTISLTNGGNRTELVDNLMIPKYASVELLETPKRLNTGGTIDVQIDQTDTVEIQISGKRITT